MRSRRDEVRRDDQQRPPAIAGRRRKRPRTSDSDAEGRSASPSPPPPPPPPPPLTAPTQYLRGRCPACFGGARRHNLQDPSAPDVLVALDACFSQKHNKQTRDPPFHHPDGIMLDEAALAAAEARVNTLRPRKDKERRKQAEFNAEAAGIRVPSEALQKCEDSFKAAQDSIAKANTGSHDVTAVMALLC
ncbi:hypothetical protein GGF50DRAFT_67355, partial [Schizophyllum commune]